MAGRLDEGVGAEFGGERFSRGRVMLLSRLLSAATHARTHGHAAVEESLYPLIGGLDKTDAEAAAAHWIEAEAVGDAAMKLADLTAGELTRLVADFDRHRCAARDWWALQRGTAGSIGT